jgi:hypothetical protein
MMQETSDGRGESSIFLPYFKWLLILLIILRVGVCVSSDQGIGWDFANYYRTGSRIYSGQKDLLYTVEASSASVFEELTGRKDGTTSNRNEVEAGKPEGEGEVGSGRLGHIGFPLSAYLFAPLGAFNPRLSLVIFKAQSAICLALALFLLYSPFRKVAEGYMRKTYILPLYLILCLFYEPFWFVFAAGGQATPLNLLLFVLFHRFYIQERSFWAAFFLSLGILIKPFFALTLVVFVFAREYRLLRNLALVLSAEVALSIMLLGLQLHLEWLIVLRESVSGLAEPWWNNSSIMGFVYTLWCVSQGAGLGPAGEVHGLILVPIAAFKVVILVMFFMLAQKIRTWAPELQERRHQLVCLSILFALLFSSIVWPHYLAFLFIPLVFLLANCAQLPKYAKVFVWLVLLSTLAVQSRFAQKFVLSLLTDYPLPQAFLAGLFGSGTLILVFLLLVTYHRQIISFRWKIEPFQQPRLNT